MVNRFMRVIVFFDLPVKSSEDKRCYTQFRKNLIKNGFMMIQYSVYVRVARNYDDAKKYISRLKSFVPDRGAVRAMLVTEKQYTSIELLVGEKLREENLLDTKDILEL